MEKNKGYEFWQRVDEKNPYNTLSELIEKANLNYGSTKTQRTNNRIPAALTVLTISKTLKVSMEYLLTGEAEKKEHYPPRVDQIAKKLCLVSEQDLALIERNVQLLPINRNSQENVVS